MPSTSKSSRRKAKKFNSVPKPKQQWRVKQPTRNWLDLPSDVMANIIQRIGVHDILENAQKVCTTWRKICKDPAMWRVIYMVGFSRRNLMPQWWEMCKHAVDRSQGHLVDITMVGFCDDELLECIAGRSSQLRRLEIAFSYGDAYESCAEALKKFPLLEELSLHKTIVPKEAIETAGKYCPLLKILKLNKKADILQYIANDEIAIAIGKNLRELRHLELIGNSLSNSGLQAILDGCCHLELLDLRQCMYVDLKGDIGKRCREQIKSLKLPNDSLDGCPFIQENDSEACDFISDSGLVSDDSDYDYHEYFGYDDDDDFTAYDDDFPDFVDLHEMMAFMAMFG